MLGRCWLVFCLLPSPSPRAATGLREPSHGGADPVQVAASVLGYGLRLLKRHSRPFNPPPPPTWGFPKIGVPLLYLLFEGTPHQKRCPPYSRKLSKSFPQSHPRPKDWVFEPTPSQEEKSDAKQEVAKKKAALRERRQLRRDALLQEGGHLEAYYRKCSVIPVS